MVVAQSELAGTLTQDLVEEVLLVVVQVEAWVLQCQTFQSDTGTHDVYLLEGIVKATTLRETLGIHQIHLIETEVDPLCVFAQVVLVHVVFVLVEAGGIALGQGLGLDHLLGLLDVTCHVVAGIGTADPELVDITVRLTRRPVEGGHLSVDDALLVETWVAAGCLLEAATHLLIFKEELSLGTVHLAFGTVGLPVEGRAVSPWEHLDILCGGQAVLSCRVVEPLVPRISSRLVGVNTAYTCGV